MNGGARTVDELRGRLQAAFAPDVVEALEQLVAETVRLELDARTEATNGRRWLTVAEAAERLGCTTDAVRMRVARGRLEHRRQGRRVYVAASAIDNLD
ncbi:MAG TPA: helix-turn-helix domain-containing protein [Gaiellaceae bacterium]|nr:helix-turn-helix domain-containing protein [Gaiellaceae bacterium]